MACSSDEASEVPVVQHEIPLSVSASTSLYADGTETRSTTRRTWTVPDGYYPYEALYSGTYENIPNLSQSTIDVFLTHDNADGEATTTENPLHARLRHSPATPPSTSQWKLSLPNVTLPGPPEAKLTEDSVKQGNYYAYGFIPRDAADNATITKLPAHSNWADGAVLTIHGMKAVATDPCVIIGAREGFRTGTEGNYTYYDGNFYTDVNGNGVRDMEEPLNKHFVNDTPTYSDTYDDGTDTRINRLKAGDFQFYLDTRTTTVEGKKLIYPNYLFFLFDHLYSALSISMKVQSNYHALRKIKLKALYLRTKTTSGTISEKTDVTITLEKNNDGANPITNITYTPSVDETKSDSIIYRNNAGFPLTTTYSSFVGHFMPQGVSTLILTSLYDVYDTKGNLIRKDCKATNTMELNELLTGQTEAKRGYKYQVNMNINPTYLYVLSEPDLDNPTVTVE